MLREEDRIRLRHMLDAAIDARRFIEGRQLEDVAHDRMLALALVKAIEIVGEAASNVSPEGRAIVPNLPWPSIVGMRHRLVHAYFEIDYERVWTTVTDDLPPLMEALERVLTEFL